MKKADVQPYLAIAGIVTIAVLLSLAGSQGGVRAGGIPVFALCAVIAFGMQWLVFIPSYIRQTEHYFDITGSLTYVTLAVTAVVAVGNWEPRSLILAGLIFLWSARLGSFLFQRVRRSGGDARFDALKRHFPSFLMTWTLQGLWVLLTSAAALAAITTTAPEPLEWIAWLGVAIWVAGFAVETIADAQKRSFKNDAANRDRFINSGLWAWSRHPNYFGEIVLWLGVAIIAAPVLAGWQWVTMISPLFVIVLLTRVSGIPILERRADHRWGGDPDYRNYKATTPVLVPRPPRGKRPGGIMTGESKISRR